MEKLIQLQCFSSAAGCGWPDIEPLVTGLLKNLIIIGMFVAAFMVSYAGFTLFKGMGEPAARSKARKILISVVIGATILFGAYYIVDLIMTKLGVVDPIRQNGV
jgi:hypothetical protein